jgi:pimeloyl-ACP methyl ester carboxylesterase
MRVGAVDGETSPAGVRIAYEVTGGHDAPSMVLLHALGQRRFSWAPVTARFAERFRVYALDLRGHGDSDWPGEYSLQLMRDDVLRVLDDLGLDKVTLVGHSMGGAVAYLIAIQYPQRVQRLIIEDAAPPFRRDGTHPKRPRGVLKFDWAVVSNIVEQRNAGDPATWDGLAKISAPTLLIGGGPQSHIPQGKLKEVAERIPHCRLVTFRAGHHVHASCPSRFADVVLDWLADD